MGSITAEGSESLRALESNEAKGSGSLRAVGMIGGRGSGSLLALEMIGGQGSGSLLALEMIGGQGSGSLRVFDSIARRASGSPRAFNFIGREGSRGLAVLDFTGGEASGSLRRSGNIVMSRRKKNQSVIVRADDDAEHAFDRLRTAREALRPEELLIVNVDVPSAAGVVLVSLPKIRALVPEMQQLPGFDPKLIDGLHDRALAMVYADAVVRASEQGPARAILAAEAKALRRTLLHQVDQLAEWKLIDPSRVIVSSGRRTGDVAKDLIALVDLIRIHWKEIDGKTPLDQDVMEHAKALAARMLEGAGAQLLSKPRIDAPSADARARAFTLLMRSYDQVRRIVAYLRWDEGDADEIAPTLYVRRRGRSVPVTPEVAPAPPALPAPPTPPVT